MVGSVFIAGHLALCRLSVKSLTFYKELDPIAYGLSAPTAPDASSDKLSVISLSWSAPTAARPAPSYQFRAVRKQ